MRSRSPGPTQVSARSTVIAEQSSARTVQQQQHCGMPVDGGRQWMPSHVTYQPRRLKNSHNFFLLQNLLYFQAHLTIKTSDAHCILEQTPRPDMESM